MVQWAFFLLLIYISKGSFEVGPQVLLTFSQFVVHCDLIFVYDAVSLPRDLSTWFRECFIIDK